MIPLQRPPHPARASARRGFTLVELLCVIAVIGVLAVILLTTLGRMRHAARATQDAAILRSLGQSMLQYAAEHQGKINYWGIETGSGANTTENGFWARAWPYLHDTKAMQLTGANLAKMAQDYISPTIAAERPDLVGNNEGVDYTVAINNTLVDEHNMGDHKEYTFQRLQNVPQPAAAPYMVIGVWGFGDLNPYPLPAPFSGGKKPSQEVYWLQDGGQGVTSVLLDGSVRVWTEKLDNSHLWNRSRAH